MSAGSRLSKNLSRFRLISFDVTDTLLKFSSAPAIQYAKTASAFGYHDIDQNQLNELFRNEFKQMKSKYPNYGKNINMEFNDWWRKLVINIFKKSTTKIPINDIKRIANKLVDIYKTEECWTKIDGADEIINKIKMNDKIVGIISNTDPRLYDVIECMKLPKFDFIVTSYEFGYEKPDKRIFDQVIQNYGINKNEALHIGNTLKIDYLGAINAGWYGIHISNNSNDWKNYPNVNGDHVFNNIRCLLNQLEKSDILW